MPGAPSLVIRVPSPVADFRLKDLSDECSAHAPEPRREMLCARLPVSTSTSRVIRIRGDRAARLGGHGVAAHARGGAQA